jgi:hypothetical protein
MANNYWQRQREEAEMAAGKIKVFSRRREMEFKYKGKWYLYVYESSTTHGFSYIYDGRSIKKQCIYNTADPTKTTDLGREIHNEIHKQMLGVHVAVYLKDEPRDRKAAFVNHICETKTDGDVTEMCDSRGKLLNAYNDFSLSNYKP